MSSRSEEHRPHEAPASGDDALSGIQAWVSLVAQVRTVRKVIPLTSKAWSVYVAMALHVNPLRDNGRFVCWPGMGELAKITGFGRESVKRAISELTLAGLVHKTRRFSAEGDPDSNLYTLSLGLPKPRLSESLPATRPQGVGAQGAQSGHTQPPGVGAQGAMKGSNQEEKIRQARVREQGAFSTRPRASDLDTFRDEIARLSNTGLEDLYRRLRSQTPHFERKGYSLKTLKEKLKLLEREAQTRPYRP